jgi:hypothetical protein
MMVIRFLLNPLDAFFPSLDKYPEFGLKSKALLNNYNWGA